MPHSDVQALRMIYQFEELHDVIEVVKRLTDAHKDDIRDGQAGFLLRKHDLVQHFRGLQPPYEAADGRGAEGAALTAADLRRDADGVAVVIAHDDGLNGVAVRKAPEVFYCAVLGGDLLSEHLRRMQEKALIQLGPQRLREVRHLVEALHAAAQPGEDLLCAKALLAHLCQGGGKLLRELKRPDFRAYGIDVPSPGSVEAQDMLVLGAFVRDVIRDNADAKNFRVFGPDESKSNRLTPMFETTSRVWNADLAEGDEYLGHSGRVMDSMLSEHMCEGWLEGYLLTGRHGFFNSYEAFIRIVDSMFSQHAKWLKTCNELPWRQDIASLNYILSSNVWQQDHNGFTHQDPGFLDHVANKKADVVRMYLPPDANCLLSCFNHCIASRNYVNVLVTSKHPRPQWLTMEQAVKHCTQGIGIWQWASNDQGQEPDVVLACCGDTPTLETLATVTILRHHFPDLKVRVINVVDLMRLQSNTQHPHGLSDSQYDMLFTQDKPILFTFHGYPSLIHELTYRRKNKNLHVRGYIEEGTITTPFDMRVLNNLDRFHLTMDVIHLLPEKLGTRGAFLIQQLQDKLVEHKQYIAEHGQDLPEIRDWKWNNGNGNYDA